MKFNKFLFGAAALSMGVFASCSSDEPVKGPNGGDENVGERYMAIRISNPANSRASEDQEGNGFELGVNNENTITAENVRFYFFNAQGQPFTLAQSNVSGEVTPNNMVKPTELNQFNQDGNETSTLKGVLVLGKSTGPYVGQTPSRVVCVANLTEDEFQALKNKSLNQILNITTKKTADTQTGKYDWSSFKMVSSTYFNGSDKVIYSEITDKNLAANIEAANESPVDIYIERIAAKVRATGLKTWESKKSDKGNVTDVKYNINNPDGTYTETTLYVNLTGWKLRNRFTEANLFKNIEVNGEYFADWNMPGYHRSYWEIAGNNGDFLVDKKYDITKDKDQFYRGNYVATATGDEYLNNVAYTYPSTFASEKPTSATDRATDATAIVVRGVVCTDAEGQNPINLVRWAGAYYEQNTFKQLVVNAYVAQTGQTATVNDVKFKPSETPNKYYAAVGANENDMNRRYDNIEWWDNGQTSFYVNIKHANKGETPLYGVVRNHIYDYIFDNVIGLGVPGSEPVNPPNEKESYVSARLNVLNWKVVSNTVTLE